MKLILLLAVLLSSQAFAANLCHFQETWEYVEALEAEGIKQTRTSRNHKRFTFLEKRMIHLAMTQDSYNKGVSQDEALILFGDYYNGRMGSNAGEIKYFQVKGAEIAIVHYWPGDNEYGAIFVVKNGSYRLLASLSDSFIECK